MATTREAIVICLDVGPEMRVRDNETNITPLEQSLECINWIIQRKIFAESKDDLAIVLFGTKETDNPLANGDDEGYANIRIKHEDTGEEWRSATWDLVKYIQNEVPPPDQPVHADFVDALVVSLDLLLRGTAGKKYAGKQLLLFSNLGSPFGDDQIDKVSAAIGKSGVDFILFGPSLYLSDDQNGYEDDQKRNGAGCVKKTRQQESGEHFMTKLLQRVEGESFSLRKGLSLLGKYTSRVIRPVPWKCNLELGEGIKIPICMYVKTKKAKIKQSWKWKHGQDPTADITMQRTYHKKEDNEDADGEPETSGQEPSTKPKYLDRRNEDDGGDETFAAARGPVGGEVEKEDLIKVFNYGTTAVPLDKLDLDAMKYKNTEKCLKIVSFIKKEQAKRQYFLSDGCHIVFSDDKDQEGSTAFLAFWKAMENENRVALVRYAHSARSAPRLGVLIPTKEENGLGSQVECFLYVGFPFTDDCRAYEFPSIDDPKTEPSAEQNEVVDDLITWMDLTAALVDENGRRCEAYQPATVVDPHIQHTFACLSHRALYENQPLPLVNKQVAASIEPLEERLHLTKPVFLKLRSTFHLKPREDKKEKRTAVDIFQSGEASAGVSSKKMARFSETQDGGDTNSAVTITSVRPVEDYTVCVGKNEDTFEKASKQLESIVGQFIFDAVDEQFYDKAADCVEVYRRKCIQLSKPGLFNGWLTQLKRRALDEGKKDFLLKIADRHLGPISDEECGSSSVTTKEAAAFFIEEEMPTIKEESAAPTEENDLLDELE